MSAVFTTLTKEGVFKESSDKIAIRIDFLKLSSNFDISNYYPWRSAVKSFDDATFSQRIGSMLKFENPIGADFLRVSKQSEPVEGR